jgi:hypothetical protein
LIFYPQEPAAKCEIIFASALRIITEGRDNLEGMSMAYFKAAMGQSFSEKEGPNGESSHGKEENPINCLQLIPRTRRRGAHAVVENKFYSPDT